jgi:hypothetical protein
MDSCASTIDEFTLCAYSPRVVDTLWPLGIFRWYHPLLTT